MVQLPRFMKNILTIIGGGLAGSEAAWQAAQSGVRVILYEMRPDSPTGAHQTGDLAELVCSNSLGSNLPDRASGLLKNELRHLGSMLLECAEATSLPAGAALAVDRELFARAVTEQIQKHPLIEVVREEVTAIPESPTIIASGPLTSPKLSRTLGELSGEEHLYFFDAIAPIVNYESINMDIAFRASRYGKGEQDEGDYINCPFTKDEYETFVKALLEAERIELRSFEEAIRAGVKAGSHHFFEGCLPVEIIAERGHNSLAFGPMRPVGLTDPRTGRRPYAVVQLRQDNLAGNLFNLVGFQTNLKFPEQRRVLRLIPGLEQRRVRALRPDAPQHLPGQPEAAPPHPAAQRPRRSILRRSNHRCGRIHGQHCHRPVRRDERRPSNTGAAPAQPSPHHHARRAVPLRHPRGYGRLSTHEG